MYGLENKMQAANNCVNLSICWLFYGGTLVLSQMKPLE
jgi:hypothetical protein